MPGVVSYFGYCARKSGKKGHLIVSLHIWWE